MRRLVGVLGAALMLVGASGCVAVSAKNNRWAHELDAVAVGEHVYVVNLRTGQVAEVDTKQLTPIGQLCPPKDDCE